VLARVQVAGVVRIIDVGRTAEGVSFSVLERCEGQTLGARLRQDPALSWREAMEMADRILAVVERVHARGVIHRDIKPDNIVIGVDGDPTLLDFGIALDRASGAGLETPPSGRPEVALYGTPEYMAPEQAARPGEVDERADLYAVGVILYEMLTGRLPFSDDSAVKLLEAKTQGSPEAPSERAPSRAIPRSADDVTLRALARHASLRYRSAADMRAAVAGVLAEPAVRRNRRRWVGLGVVLASMACAGGVLAASATRLGPEVTAFASRAGLSIGGTEAPAIATPDPAPAEPLDALNQGSAPPEAQAPTAPLSPSPPAAPEPPPIDARVAGNEAEPSPEQAAAPAPVETDAEAEAEPETKPKEKKRPRKVKRSEPKKTAEKKPSDKKKGDKPARKRKGKTKPVRD